MDWVNIIDIAVPLVTALAGWLVGTRKRKNDFLHEMQESINMLSTKNKELLEELLEMREENVKLRGNIDLISSELEGLRKEVKSLRESKRELKDLRILRKKYEDLLADNNISYM